MAKRKSSVGTVLGVLLVGALIGCTVERSTPDSYQQREQRKNLREVRGSVDQFNTQLGDPEGRGEIPAGRR